MCRIRLCFIVRANNIVKVSYNEREESAIKICPYANVYIFPDCNAPMRRKLTKLEGGDYYDIFIHFDR